MLLKGDTLVCNHSLKSATTLISISRHSTPAKQNSSCLLFCRIKKKLVMSFVTQQYFEGLDKFETCPKAKDHHHLHPNALLRFVSIPTVFDPARSITPVGRRAKKIKTPLKINAELEATRSILWVWPSTRLRHGRLNPVSFTACKNYEYLTFEHSNIGEAPLEKISALTSNPNPAKPFVDVPSTHEKDWAYQGDYLWNRKGTGKRIFCI